ncbi:hypothetical protein GCM10009647_043050 [Streptomyces sanglieri]
MATVLLWIKLVTDQDDGRASEVAPRSTEVDIATAAGLPSRVRNVVVGPELPDVADSVRNADE